MEGRNGARRGFSPQIRGRVGSGRDEYFRVSLRASADDRQQQRHTAAARIPEGISARRSLLDTCQRAARVANPRANQIVPPAEAISSMAICVAWSGTETWAV